LPLPRTTLSLAIVLSNKMMLAAAAQGEEREN